MTEAYEWDGDWYAITDKDERARLDRELQQELCPGHIRHGVTASVIGKRRARADFLYLLADGRFAQVHLTWKPEQNPTWPWTEIYSSFDAWKSVPPEDR